MFYFLIGFMGAGKTSLGKQIAVEQDWQFIDLDEYIEEKEGNTIAQLFVEKGEHGFRQIEADALRSLVHIFTFPSLVASTPIIIACGGGTPLFFNNHEFMKGVGKTVYLQVSAETLTERLIKEKEKRPILQNIPNESLLNFIGAKLHERESEYKKADIILRDD